MYEHFTDADDMSFKIVQSPHLSSAEDDDYIKWIVDDTADSRYIASHRDSMRIIIFKTSTYGKNPYYDGPLSGLVTSDGEWKKLYYTNNLAPFEVSAESIVLAGTYNVYENAINSSESNELYNINDVESRYDEHSMVLTLRFKKNEPKLSSWIAYHDLGIIIIDDLDLRVYAQYHFLDPTAYLSGSVWYDFDTGSVYDNRKFRL